MYYGAGHMYVVHKFFEWIGIMPHAFDDSQYSMRQSDPNYEPPGCIHGVYYPHLTNQHYGFPGYIHGAYYPQLMPPLFIAH